MNEGFLNLAYALSIGGWFWPIASQKERKL